MAKNKKQNNKPNNSNNPKPIIKNAGKETAAAPNPIKITKSTESTTSLSKPKVVAEISVENSPTTEPKDEKVKADPAQQEGNYNKETDTEVKDKPEPRQRKLNEKKEPTDFKKNEAEHEAKEEEIKIEVHEHIDDEDNVIQQSQFLISDHHEDIGSDTSEGSTITDQKVYPSSRPSTAYNPSLRVKSPLHKVEFAPINVPLARRRETFAHLVYETFLFNSQFFFLICCFNPLLWPILIIYLIYILNDLTPETGSRGWTWFRQLSFWRWYCNFYPASIIKECDLDPGRTYIFGYHPHGIIGMGAFSAFATDGCDFSKLFPNINVRLLTLSTNFKLPFFRELLLALNVGSVSKRSITNILNKGPGNACAIVVGGAAESLLAKPDRADLVLASRYGFVRIAIKQGADLVPVFGFGENQLYDQLDNNPGSLLFNIQNSAKKLLGFTFPVFYGRGVFTYNLGILPHRVPLTIVVGKPIRVEKDSNPTDDAVKQVHAKYLQAVTDLYQRHSASCWVGEDPPTLKFI